MDARMLRDIQRRLARLERTSVRYRAGEVTGTGPLDVALGGSGVSYKAVRALPGRAALKVGDRVAAFVWGNDVLVAGVLGDGKGGSIAQPSVARSLTSGGNYTTTSATAVAIDATNLAGNVRINGASDVVVARLDGMGGLVSSVGNAALDLYVDGVLKSRREIRFPESTGATVPIAAGWKVAGLSNGLHAVEVRWARLAGTGTVTLLRSTTYPVDFELGVVTPVAHT